MLKFVIDKKIKQDNLGNYFAYGDKNDAEYIIYSISKYMDLCKIQNIISCENELLILFYLIVYIGELILLLISTRLLTKYVSSIFHRLTKHKTVTVYLLAILFLPGTIIHELSHVIMAGLLGLRSGKINLIPEIIGSEIKMGTAQIEHSDSFRRALIGIAPFIFGNIILFITVYFIVKYVELNNILYVVLLNYLLFQISNTMFSSKKDLEGVSGLFIAIPFILTASIIAFISQGIHLEIPPHIFNITQRLIVYMIFPVILNFIIIILLKIIKR